MKNWYRSLTKAQKIFSYLVAAILPLIGGGLFGDAGFFLFLAPLAILVFLQLGASA